MTQEFALSWSRFKNFGRCQCQCTVPDENELLYLSLLILVHIVQIQGPDAYTFPVKLDK